MEGENPKPLAQLDGSTSRQTAKMKNLLLQTKLSLKKGQKTSLSREPENSRNISNMSKENCSEVSKANESNEDDSLNDDSLRDFRSPAKCSDSPEITMDLRFETVDRSKRKNKTATRNDSKDDRKKKQSTRDTSQNENQQSIESSFFKPKTSIQTSFVCPLCFKTYNEVTAKNNHMKSCAARNKISTRKLLDIVQLQEKQAEERKAMGLLAAPVVQPKKTISRKMISDKDPQLQVALALSMSLQEAEEAEFLEQQYNLGLGEHLNYDRKTLQNFGFTTNKPVVASTTVASRKKRLAGPTILQTRTQEERERLITDRIAEILMGDEAITQAMSKNASKVVESDRNIVIRSQLLQRYCRVNDRLWDRAQLASSSKHLYFCDLVGIEPCNTEDNSSLEMIQKAEINSVTSPQQKLVLPKIASPKIIDNDERVVTKELKKTSENRTSNARESFDKEKPPTSMSGLERDWSTFVGFSSGSDVIVMTKDGGHIYAHKFVFFVRCPNIIDDVVPADDPEYHPIKEKIYWLDTHNASAFAFLEFIYCGLIHKKLCVFNDNALLTDVRVLARKYQARELFTYLRDKQRELENHETKRDSLDNSAPKRKLSFDGSTDHTSSLGDSVECLSSDFNEKSDKSAKKWKSILSALPSFSFDITNEQGHSAMSIPDENRAEFTENDSVTKEAAENNGSLSMKFELSKELIRSKKLSTSVVLFEKNNEISDHRPNSGEITHDSTVDRSKNTLGVISKNQRSISPDIFDDSTVEYSPSADRSPEPDGSRFSDASTKDGTDFTELLNNSRKKSPIEILDSSDDSNSPVPVENNKYETTKPTNNSCDSTFNETNVTTRRRNIPRESIIENRVTSASKDGCENSVAAPSTSRACTKQKSDISLAIERIQRLNAKSASDSDSELEVSLPDSSLRKKYTKERCMDDSNSYEKRVRGIVPFKVVDDLPPCKRRGLSIFEQKIRNEAAKNIAVFDITSHESASDLAPPSTPKRSSISPKSDLNITSIVDLSPKSGSKSIDPNHTICDLTQGSTDENKPDSDADEDHDISAFSQYRRKNSQNSIDMYRIALRRRMDRNLNITNDSSPQLTPNEVDVSPQMNERVKVSSVSTNPTERNTIVKNPLTFDETELSDLEIDMSTFTEQDCRGSSKNIDTSNENHSNSMTRKRSSHATLGDKKSSVETHDSIHGFNDLVLSDTEFTILKNTEDKEEKDHLSDKDTDVECCVDEVPYPHPSQIISSGSQTFEARSHIHNSSNETVLLDNRPLISSENEEMIDRNSTLRTSRSSKTTVQCDSSRNRTGVDRTTVNIYVEPDSDSDATSIPSPSKKLENNSLRKKSGKITPLLTESSDDDYTFLRKRNSPLRFSEGKDLDDRSRHVRGGTVSPRKSPRTSVRILAVKSVSENIIQTGARGKASSSHTLVASQGRTPSRKRKNSDEDDEHTPKRDSFSKNMPPRPRYTEMRTPDLSKELNKYGLKKQSRQKAKQLLRHIYHQLHPSSPTGTEMPSLSKPARKGSEKNSSETAKKPVHEDSTKSAVEKSYPNAKAKRTTKNVESITSDDTSTNEYSAEEMDTDSDGSEIASQSNGRLCLETGFRKLIEVDKSLHNKILTYEPLHLENLHATLKAQGIKCNRTALMNFLHEQCITFRTMAKDNTTRNRKKRK